MPRERGQVQVAGKVFFCHEHLLLIDGIFLHLSFDSLLCNYVCVLPSECDIDFVEY